MILRSVTSFWVALFLTRTCSGKREAELAVTGTVVSCFQAKVIALTSLCRKFWMTQPNIPFRMGVRSGVESQIERRPSRNCIDSYQPTQVKKYKNSCKWPFLLNKCLLSFAKLWLRIIFEKIILSQKET